MFVWDLNLSGLLCLQLCYLSLDQNIEFLLPNFPINRQPASAQKSWLLLPHIFKFCSVFTEICSQILIRFQPVLKILNWLKILQKEVAFVGKEEDLLDALVLQVYHFFKPVYQTLKNQRLLLS